MNRKPGDYAEGSPSATGSTASTAGASSALAFGPEVVAAGPFRLAFYIAGTDVAAEDPLGGLALSGDALLTRDRLVLTALRTAGTAVVVLAGGGYGPQSYLHLANSLSYVMAQGENGS